MAHIVLLGDSIFDNKAYVAGAPDVVTHLRGMIPHGWQATLKAVDGNLVEDVQKQIRGVPEDVTHLIVSAGGNNALQNSNVLQMRAGSAAEVFSNLYERIADFEEKYRRMLETLADCKLSVAVCTVYYPNFPEDLFQKIATAALSSFNDIIVKQAILAGVPVIDLRLICSEPDDYANQIEPSSKGGAKIAAGILEAVEQHDFSTKRTSVYY